MPEIVPQIRNWKAVDGAYTFIINEYEGEIALIINFKPSRLVGGYSKQLRVTVLPKRVIKLAKDILAHFNKKMKYKEWSPTFADLERKLKEKYGDDAIYDWMTNWLRLPWNNKRAKRLYEWLQTGEELGLFKGEKREWRYETCKICRREQRLTWAVKDEVWEEVMGEYKRVVCLECFLRKADEKKIRIKKDDFIYLGWIEESVKGDYLKEQHEVFEHDTETV